MKIRQLLFFICILIYVDISWAKESLSKCLKQANETTLNETNSQKTFISHRRCITKLKDNSTYNECIQAFKGLKNKNLMYLCSSVTKEGTFEQCLKETFSVYNSIPESRFANFAIDSCFENFKETGDFNICVDIIKNSSHKELIDSCVKSPQNGSLNFCLKEVSLIYQSVNDTRRAQTAHQRCIDVFRKEGFYEDCVSIARNSRRHNFSNLCVILPKRSSKELRTSEVVE